MKKIEYEVHSLRDFKEIIDSKFKGKIIFYRGQLEKYESITPSISRNIGYINQENFFYKIACEKHPNEFAEINLPIEKLAKLQHYSIPTRLIDFTTSWEVALYFAVEGDDTEKNNSLVYVYDQILHTIDDKNIKLISLLPTLKSLDMKLIEEAYKAQYNETITKNEILSLVSIGGFVAMSKEYLKNNNRMRKQEGLFYLCGNEIENNRIKSELQKFSIEPEIIIRIPYEFRKIIKEELDRKGINKINIYPELPSVGEYLKDKYNKKNINLNDYYQIVNIDDVSHALAKRLAIEVILDKNLDIKNILILAKKIIENYKNNNDVVWVYIADKQESYISKNWIIMMQWTNPNLDKMFKPMCFSIVDNNGYSWEIKKGYSLLSDFYEEHIFRDDSELLVKSKEIFANIVPYIKKINILVNKMNRHELTRYGLESKSDISDYFLKISNIGLSKNDKFNDFLRSYIECSSLVYNVVIILTRDDLNDRAYEYMILKYLNDVNKKFREIGQNRNKWEKEINRLCYLNKTP